MVTECMGEGRRLGEIETRCETPSSNLGTQQQHLPVYITSNTYVPGLKRGL